MNIKEFLKLHFPVLLKLRLFYRELLLKYFPVYATKVHYRKVMGKEPDLINPKDLNEKILWLKLHSDTSKWPDLADKYKVREYVKQCGLGYMLNDLYAVWQFPEDMNFEKLPAQFVLKTNNGSGDVIVVKDKSTIDEARIRKELKLHLNRRFGVLSAEPHYLKIKPLIICEKYLKESSSLSSSLIDYKFYCNYGKVLALMVCFDRTIGGHAEKIIYNIEPWKPMCEYVKSEYKTSGIMKSIPKPKSLSEMLDAASILSKEFPLVRVDFYEIEGKPIFGEMTFTSEAGCIKYLTEEFLLKIGEMIDIKFA